MGENDAENADVEHLLGDPTIHLDPIGRDAHHGRYRRRQRRAIDDLAAVKHELQGLAEAGKIKGRVFHFEGDTIELGARHGDGAFDVHGSKRDENGSTLFEGFDNAVEAGYVWHRDSFRSFKKFKLFKPFKSLNTGTARSAKF
jgi:hypothetical protein